MNLKVIIITLAFASVYQMGFTQSCGTMVTAGQKTLENTFIVAQANPSQSLPQINRDLSVAVYVIKDTTGNAVITDADITAVMPVLSAYFSPIALKFHVCKITYVDNHQFDILYADKNEKDLTNSYSMANRINIYVVSSLFDMFNNSINGFTYMPVDNKDFIFITKKSFNGSELGHQMGHLFNLYHTHETIFDFEYVDKSNCTTAGDRCCDTEADPNLSGFISNNCLYNGMFKDANPSNSQFYKPSGKNLMSFSKDECRCYFSPTQYLRIVYALQNLKSSLK